MKAKLITLDNKAAGEVTLKKEVFGLPARSDILHRVVIWQLAKRQAGTHKTKTVSEVSGTTAKPYAQKGTGRARQGSLRSVQFRGGGQIHAPVVRSHAIAMPKKLRALGLKTALSVKFSEGKLLVLKDAKLKEPKSALLAKTIAAMGFKSVLVIDAQMVDANFKLAAANLEKINVLPVQGANVYDILRHENILVTEEAVKKLEERLA